MKYPELSKELIQMKDDDANTRKKLLEKGELFRSGYHPTMKAVHEKNNLAMASILDRYGWPGISLVGKEGCYAAWLIVQHAVLNLALQKQALRLLKQAVASQEADPIMLAFLEDRVLMADGKPQRYGTQHVVDEVTDELIPYHIDHPEEVNHRRLAIGMEPLEEKTAALNAERKANK